MRFWEYLRQDDWVTLERARLWACALLIAYAAVVACLFLTAHGLNDYQGRPLGSDFSNIYAAGVQANAGHAADIYVPAKHLAAERAIFGAKTLFYGWHYPPFLLLIATPLAWLPYFAALFVWQAATFALYLGAMALLLRGTAIRSSTWLLFAIAFPAVLANLLAGHNGFLTAALLAGALALLDTRPVIAGVLFGLLAYKPQFGLMIPLALLVTARWRAIGGAVLSVIGLSLLCTVAFGMEIWTAFLASEQFTRTVVLEQGQTGFYRIQSMFAWVRLWGGPVSLAYAAQGLLTLLCAVSVFRIWRSGASQEIKNASLCIAAILATPYSLDYDLMALAPAIALLAVDGIAGGFRPYEKSLLAGLWMMPFVARALPALTLIPIAVPVMIAALALTLRYAAGEASRARFAKA
ncbi:MAG TPA: glycosyltransferase family 87 protein [Rhizomicrobium sp.]